MKKALSIIFFAVLSGVYAPASYADGRTNVVVSIYPLADIVRQVGGDMVNVDYIVPAGASPHTFEPAPSDMIKINKAKILVIIGAGFEFWADKAVKAGRGKDLKVLVLSRGIKLIHNEHGSGGEKNHRHESEDPHIWLDPLLTIEIVNKVRNTLAETDVRNKAYYEKRAKIFSERLSALHSSIAASVKGFRIKEYVTFHPAWNYFSKRYGLRVIGVIEESPGREPSPGHIADLIGYIIKSGAGVVFAEPQFNPKIAEVIAKEAGAKLLLLDPVGGPGLRDRDTYIALMEYNMRILEKAMK